MSGEEGDDLGELIYAVRPLPRLLPILIGVAVVAALDLFALATNGWSLAVLVFVTLGAVLVIGAAAGSGYLEHHRVYEHAVVLGLSWPRKSASYVVPVRSIDPDSVTVHFRANMIARRLGTGGSPTMRMAVYSTRAVSFLGESWETAARSRDGAAGMGERKRRALRLRQATFGRGALPSGSTSLWALGVRDPAPLLRALERALAADGRPQPGLAERAAAHPVVEPSGEPR